MTTTVKIYENPVVLGVVGLTFLVLGLITWSLALGLTGTIILYLGGMTGDHLKLQTDHMVLKTEVEVLAGRVNAALELVEAQQDQIHRLRRSKANRPDLFPEKFPG